MSYARQLLDASSRTFDVDPELLAATLGALGDCAQACESDADANLAEENPAGMARCIRLCLDCADVCTATLAVTSRQAEYNAAVAKPLLQACVAACKSCGDECQRHAPMHEHCRVCEQACRRCERACQELYDALK